MSIPAIAATVGTALAERAVERVVNTIKGGGTAKKKKPKSKKKNVVRIVPPSKKAVMMKAIRPLPAVPLVAPSNLNNAFHIQRSIKRNSINKFGKSIQIDAINCKGRILTTQLSTTFGNYNDFYSIAINPNGFQSTKLGDAARDYQRFKFNRLVFEFEPTVSANTSGAICMYYVYDPEIKLNGAQNTIQYMQSAMTLDFNKITQLWKADKLVINMPDDGSSYYCMPDINGEERLTVQGVFKIMTAANNLNGYNPFGYLTMYYDIDFWESVEAATRFDTSLQFPSYNADGSLRASIIDTLRGNVSVYIPTNAVTQYGLTSSTVYYIIPTFTMGHMKAWNTYFFYFGASSQLGNTTPLYTTASDAQNSTTENTVAGSSFYVDQCPQDSIIFVSSWGGGSVPTAQVSEQRKLIDNLLALRLFNLSALSEEDKIRLGYVHPKGENGLKIGTPNN